eukprot:TRINITY_DN1617_c0_g1_i1.p1 TRINITY_DN1617_c0_g1~~TRINITY_DN1617_c0_g1_i1.p1  ORF type:complete len:232 (-),score=65.76 TRINITY_DN1617_c0_g1_i1:87-782(-)
MEKYDKENLPAWMNPNERNIFLSKVGNYPFWPSRLISDDDIQTEQIKLLFQRVKPHQLVVKFFGEELVGIVEKSKVKPIKGNEKITNKNKLAYESAAKWKETGDSFLPIEAPIPEKKWSIEARLIVNSPKRSLSEKDKSPLSAKSKKQKTKSDTSSHQSDTDDGSLEEDKSENESESEEHENTNKKFKKNCNTAKEKKGSESVKSKKSVKDNVKSKAKSSNRTRRTTRTKK